MKLDTGIYGWTVTYRKPETGKLAKKVIKAKTDCGALCIFKRTYGIKGIKAEYRLTAADKREQKAVMAEARKVNGRATYFDGRTMCYCDNDGVVGMENGYTH